MIAPTVVCLCGSSRFKSAFEIAAMHETLMGRLVVSVGMFGHADSPDGARHLCADGDDRDATKQILDELHLRKIDLADEILVVNVGGYVGSSTSREIAYAVRNGKRVRFLFGDEPAAVVS